MIICDANGGSGNISQGAKSISISAQSSQNRESKLNNSLIIVRDITKIIH